MDGVIFEQNSSTLSTICIVENLSDELKELIRNNLSSICQGVSRGESGKSIYSYRNTLEEFLIRYDTKTKNTKKGIIGELLAHILFIEFFQDFQTVSPLFNMEERNIKKSFDVILFHASSQELYYTEVKSGSARNYGCNKKNINLLYAAKADILEKLNVDNDNNWLNAINGSTIALEKKKIKNEIVNILEECLEDSQKHTSGSTTKNIILVSVTYNSLIDKIMLSWIHRYSSNLSSGDDFKIPILFSIQKDTYNSIEIFLRNEVDNG